MEPCVDFFERLRCNRLLATCLTFFIGLSFLVLLSVVAIPGIVSQLASLKVELPKYIEGISGVLANVEAPIEKFFGKSFDLNLHGEMQTLLTSFTSSIFGDVALFLSSSLKTLILAPFLTFFFLKDGRLLSKKLVNLVPNSYFEFIFSLHHQINENVGQFIRIRFLEAAIVGFVVWCGLLALDFPFAAILGIFVMLTNLVPYVGPIIGVTPAIIISVVNGYSHLDLFLIMGIYGLAQLIDNVLVIPIIVARLMNLHPITVVITLLIGAQFMGIMGMLISLPVVNICKLTLTNIYHHFIEFRR